MSENQLPLSIIIITLDEARNLERCLNSLPRGSEVIVVDSHSTDETRDIAERYGALVKTRAFKNYQDQKNAALSFTSKPWVLSLDADEELTPILQRAITEMVRADPLASDARKFRIKRRLVFMEKVLNFGRSVDHPTRLFVREGARFKGAIHEQINANGKLATLDGHMLHFSYANLEDYFERFNRYTSAVANAHHQRGKRAHMAALVVRPWWEFFSRFVLRLGFLDGYPGYAYALCSSLYAFTKYAKLKELSEPGSSRL